MRWRKGVRYSGPPNNSQGLAPNIIQYNIGLVNIFTSATRNIIMPARGLRERKPSQNKFDWTGKYISAIALTRYPNNYWDWASAQSWGPIIIGRLCLPVRPIYYIGQALLNTFWPLREFVHLNAQEAQDYGAQYNIARGNFFAREGR